MEATIEFSPTYSLLNVLLDAGETVRAEPGAMVAQRGVTMRTGAGGSGFGGGLRRMLGGESFFVNTFTAGVRGGLVCLAPPGPGDIVRFDVRPDAEIYLQSGAFVACTGSVELDSRFQGLKGVFSGHGMVFLRAHCKRDSGMVFYGSYGAISALEVVPGEELVVDTGHLVAFTTGVDYSIGKVGGIGSFIAGGEGLVTKFTGAGTVWVQTRNIGAFAAQMAPFLSKKR